MAKGIYKRGQIYWLRYAGLDGSIIRESSGSTKFKEAETLFIKRKQTIKEGKQPEIKRILNHTFRGLAEEYMKWAERQRSFKSKRIFILQLVATFGNLPLRQFNSKLLEQFQTERIQKGNKPATANRLLATLKHMFTKAVEWDMVEEEIQKRIRKIKLLEENNRRLRYLSKEECQTLINACIPHLRPIVITALNTGMRKEEILSLEWERHIDLKHGFILLDVTKNGDRREIPINQTLRETLQYLVRGISSPYVFIDGDGKRFMDVRASFPSACRRAGIKDFRFHDLRHTFASQLVMAGIDLTTVSRLLGHKSLTMTLRYSHLAPSHMTKALEILDETLSGNSTAQKLHNLGVA